MASEPPLKSPETSGGDAAHTVARAALSAVPVIGGPLVELFQHLVQPPVERRRARWMEEVGERLQALSDEGIKLQDLQNNEEFISAVLHTTQIALRTHQEEKLAALKGALESIARGQAPEDAKQYMFFFLVDTMSPLQLRILALFRAPPPLTGISIGGLSLVLEQGIPELRGKRELYDQLWKELFARGLVNTESLSGTMSANGLTSRRTTGLGEEFLRFIRAQ